MCLHKYPAFLFIFFIYFEVCVIIFINNNINISNTTIIIITINIIIYGIIPVFQFWSCYVGCTGQYKDAVRMSLDQLDVIKKFVSKYPDTFKFETTAKGIFGTPLGKPFLVFSSLLFFLSQVKHKILYSWLLLCLQPREIYKINVGFTFSPLFSCMYC